MTIEFNIQVDGLEPQLKRLVDYDRISNKHLTKAMNKAVIYTASQIKPLVPVGVSSRLKNSIGSEVVQELGSIIGRVGSSLKDEVYPKVMEFGRAPGTNISNEGMESLTRWVHVKRISGVYSVKTHQRLGKKVDQHAQDRAAAYMIALSIFRHGIKGRHYMQKGFEKSKNQIQTYFNQAIDAIVQELTNNGH